MRTAARNQGINAVEISLVISVVGVALAMFVPAFTARFQRSKFDDVHHELEHLTRAVEAYYSARHEVHGVERARCLPASAGPTPEVVGVDPVDLDFAAEGTPGSATWAALGFQPERPGRFRYRLSVTQARCNVTAPQGTALARIEAEADLDGDGYYSNFRRELVVGEQGELRDGDLLRVSDRTE